MAALSAQAAQHKQFPEVFDSYIEAGSESYAAGEKIYGAEEIVAALGVVATGYDHCKINIEGESFDSWRLRTRVGGDEKHPRPAKGGIRYDEEVTREEVEILAVTMGAKNILLGLPFAGGKGGVAISRKDLENLDEWQRSSLNAQHALSHDYNPRTNVGAPDIGTTTEDMDQMILALDDRFKELARACFTGASVEYGGMPEFRAPATGLGAVFVMDEYLKEEANHNPRLDDILHRRVDKRISVITQGNGKAGAPFNANLPDYAGLKAVLEANGAIKAKSGFLDPNQVSELVKHSLLSPETPLPPNIEWLEPKAFWETPAHIVVPAARDQQITPEVVNGLHEQVMAVVGIANNPTTTEAARLLKARGIDEIVDRLANSGGVSGSYWEWAKLMHTHAKIDVGWRDAYKRAWEQRMRSTARIIFRATKEARELSGEFITIASIVDRRIVNGAMRRYGAAA